MGGLSFLFLLSLSLLVHGEVVGRNDIQIEHLTLFVDGMEYYIKGIAYEPVPLGRADMAPDETGGTGLCSPRQTPFGEVAAPVPEFKSACYDSDYFDGAVVPGGPPNGWFRSIWERDLPVMNDLGVNTIRLYNVNPTTLQASIQQLGTDPIAFPLGKDHLPFMDYAEERDLKVMFPLIADKWMLLNTPVEEYEQYLRNQIEEVGNHSALLMYSLGNELDLIYDDDPPGTPGLEGAFLDLVNYYIDYAREYQETLWGRFVPITVAVVDYPTEYSRLVESLHVDIFTANAGYRGAGFTNLWTGTGPAFPGWRELSCLSQKPLLIGEWGWEAVNNSQTLIQGDWFNIKFADLLRNNENGCIGGIFFEFNDEPLKAEPNQQTMGVTRFVPTNCSTTLNCFDPIDILEPKEIIFEAMRSGLYEGVPVNYNSDVFALLNRPQRTLETATPLEACDPFTPANPITESSVSSDSTSEPSETSSSSSLPIPSTEEPVPSPSTESITQHDNTFTNPIPESAAVLPGITVTLVMLALVQVL